MKRKISLFAAPIGLAFVVLPAAARACAVCIGGAAGDRLTDAFNWSVLFLMAMPYSILAAVAGFFYYNHRRAAKKSGAKIEATPVFNFAWLHKESGR
jgi:hypothetical protein